MIMLCGKRRRLDMKLLDRYRVLLLDMNGTFMIDEDRFAAHEDFYRTYLDVGGGSLSAAEVTHYIRACYEGMSRNYADPACYDGFPSLAEGLKRYANPPKAEAVLLERVFALHASSAGCPDGPRRYCSGWRRPTSLRWSPTSGHPRMSGLPSSRVLGSARYFSMQSFLQIRTASSHHPFFIERRYAVSARSPAKHFSLGTA